MLSKLLKYEFRATGRIMLPVYALLLVTAGGTSVTGSLMGRYPESTVLSIFRTLFMTLFAFTTFGVLLLKYEFRATGRIMLPVYALLLVTAGGTSVTGSLMGRYPESTVLSIFRTLFMTLFAFTTFGVLLLTLVLMVYRFYKNLMTDEGYLMFTLPVSRSQLIWSKLIVSMAWGILSAVLAALMWTMVLSVAGGENLFAGIFRGLRSLMESLSGNATGCIVGLVVLLLAAGLASYLRFYAAISLGHSFSNHKVLLSVVFYIGFGIAVQTILSVVTAAGIRIDVDPDFWADPPAAVLLSYVIWGTAAWSVLECAAYYILTLLTLKKRLNLQ